ncbi:MAG TPA: FmdB family zinc ribbon protein [Terriglobales bacterium]|jgi:putative FmdB family regulatory protein
MPLYEYECKKCGHRFERIQKFSDPHVTKCPKCKGKVEQLLSAPAVQFKGSGWYVTDYAKASSGSANGDSGKPKEERVETAKTEASKTETAKTDSAKSESPSKKKSSKK